MMSSLETIFFNTFTELHGHSRTLFVIVCNCRSNQFFNLKIMFSHINLKIMILLIYTFLKVHLILKQRRQILPLGHRQLAMFVMSALMLCSRATMPAFHNGVEIFFDVSFTISYQPVWIRIRNNIQIKKVKYCNWKKENFPIRERKIFN